MEGESPLNPRDAKAFVFDLDGTLATIPVDWEAVRERLKSVTGKKEELRPIFPTIGEVISRNPELGAPIFAAIEEFELKAVQRSRLYDGAYSLLFTLKDRAVISLVTMQGRRSAMKVLEMFDLEDFFSHSFTREDSLDRAEQLEMALTSMRVDKPSSVFVGDRLNDLNAAKKVGVPFVLVRTHGDDPEEDDIPVYHSLAEFAAAMV